MAAPNPLADILGHLAEGHLVVLPNARGARNLRRAFDEHQRQSGLSAWEPARAISWQQWTSGLYADLILSGAEQRILINAAQEHTVWLEVIASQDNPSADRLADLASSALQLAAQYGATTKLHATANTFDARQFAEWTDHFLNLCARYQLLSPALLDEALREHAQLNTLTIPNEIHLAGFGPLMPSQNALLEALSIRGTTITHLPLTQLTAPKPPQLLSTPTEESELTAAALHLREFLTSPNPPRSVAIIVPNPDANADLESALRAQLTPELQSVHADLSSTPWEFSSGQPLASLSLIQAALELGRWAASTLPFDRISALLLNPYLGTSEDREIAARFDAQVLRKAKVLRPETDLPSLLALASTQSERALPPSWLRPLQQAITHAGDLTKPRTFAGWTEVLRTLTHAAGWPGPRALTATDVEATLGWDSTLDLVATLDFTGRRIPFAQFLDALDRQLNKTTFTPPSAGAFIQVLSPEEAQGSLFDATLFLRATDANWPRQQRPNPLLGWSLQQSLQMPGSDPTLDTLRAQKLTQSLIERSASILFTFSSTASATPDAHQRLSPLVASLNPTPLEATQATSHPEPIALETVVDNAPLPPLPSEEVRGGARVLKLQAACGFLAFAELRLHSAAPDDHGLGLDALESGNILHGALERFWRRVETRDALVSLTTDQRAAILRPAIEASIPANLRIDSNWDRAYLDVQKERLLTVLQNWLRQEERRGPFCVIAQERKELITVGPLTLTVRIDRVDQVEGGHLFVDYKTGSAASPSQWEGDRPEEPQLPLYSLFSQPGELRGMAFARVRAGDGVEWKGYQAEAGLLPIKATKDMDLAIEEWKQTLTTLAHDYASGIASVSPRDILKECERCAQRLLCRIRPEGLVSDEESEDLTGGDE